MTNEELVMQIKLGKEELIPQLWEQVEKLIGSRAAAYLSFYPIECEQLFDDMVQESYFYFLKAIDNYDPERGLFSSCLSWHIKNAFIDVLRGGTTERKQKDPLNDYVSIDMPLTDDMETRIVDMLVDEDAENEIHLIEDEDLWRVVNGMLSGCINSLRSRKQRELMRYMFDNNATVRMASEALWGDINDAYNVYEKAKENLYCILCSKARRESNRQHELDFFYGWGVKGYEEHNRTSVVEWTVLQRMSTKRREMYFRTLRKEYIKKKYHCTI